jgi:transketolase
VAAAEELAIRGIEATVMVVATLNPAPVADLAEVLARFPVALCVEAHYAVGGVGSLVAEVIAEQGIHSRVVRCAVKQTPNGLSGSQDYLYRINGLSREALVETALHALNKVAV